MERISRPNGTLDWMLRPDGNIEIVDIVVTADRRTGVGTSMVDELNNIAKERGVANIFAITRVENEVAQQFYESLDFEVSGILRRFYLNNCHALVYRRKVR